MTVSDIRINRRDHPVHSHLAADHEHPDCVLLHLLARTDSALVYPWPACPTAPRWIGIITGHLACGGIIIIPAQHRSQRAAKRAPAAAGSPTGPA